MEPPRVRCILSVRGGASRRVGINGLLIGRHHDCDLVASDPSMSRRHALVRLHGDGAELVPLGRGWITINGKPCERPTQLANGDVLGFPSLELGVEVAAQRPDADAPATFRLVRERGGSFGITHSPFVLGSGERDDLIIRRWPATALRFHVAQGELYVEPVVGKAARNGVEIATGALEACAVGDQLVYRKDRFIVQATDRNQATTVVGGAHALPTRVVIETLPRGGRIVFTVAGGERVVYLSDRRLDLLIALVRPGNGFAAGEFVPDEVVREVVWPRNPGISRPEINMLISRVRHDLVDAGLAGPRLIERAPGGGATRLTLAPDAVVTIDG